MYSNYVIESTMHNFKFALVSMHKMKGLAATATNTMVMFFVKSLDRSFFADYHHYLAEQTKRYIHISQMRCIQLNSTSAQLLYRSRLHINLMNWRSDSEILQRKIKLVYFCRSDKKHWQYYRKNP